VGGRKDPHVGRVNGVISQQYIVHNPFGDSVADNDKDMLTFSDADASRSAASDKQYVLYSISRVNQQLRSEEGRKRFGVQQHCIGVTNKYKFLGVNEQRLDYDNSYGDSFFGHVNVSGSSRCLRYWNEVRPDIKPMTRCYLLVVRVRDDAADDDDLIDILA